MYDIIELSRKLLPDLKDIAKELDIKKVESYKKQDLIYKILDNQAIKASEKKPEEKKFKSPRDLNQPKREEGSVLNKLFGFRKEEKRIEVPEEKAAEQPAEMVESEVAAPLLSNEPRREGRKEYQIKKRPRTEHIKAGSSNHNPNQGPKPNHNQNPIRIPIRSRT